jgi:lipoprotein signal peptidase
VKSTESFVDQVNKRKNLFLALLLFSAAGIAFVLLADYEKYLFIPMTAIAVVIWVFPFSTPQTVALLGIRRSILVTRSLSLVITAIGAGLSFL